jgi:Holliday junction resolvase
MLERDIKKKCREQLEKWGWMVIHLIQTNANGIPDTLILRKSVAYFIEFKQPTKEPRVLQDYRIRKLQEQGFQTLVVTSLKDIEKLK